MASLATIRTDVYTAFKNLLDTGTYALTTNNIYPYVSDIQRAQKDYPLVEIKVNIDSIPRDTLNGGNLTVEGSVMITAYHNSSANIKSLADEITNKLTTWGAKQVLAGGGITIVDIDEDLQEPFGYMPKRTEHASVITVMILWGGV